MDPQISRYFQNLIGKIREHPKYGPNLDQAASRQAPLCLNYHTHGPGTGYCISIAVNEEVVPGLVGNLQELAHIKGVGREEGECKTLCDSFAEELRTAYRLQKAPFTLLNGKPLP